MTFYFILGSNLSYSSKGRVYFSFLPVHRIRFGIPKHRNKGYSTVLLALDPLLRRKTGRHQPKQSWKQNETTNKTNPLFESPSPGLPKKCIMRKLNFLKACLQETSFLAIKLPSKKLLQGTESNIDRDDSGKLRHCKMCCHVGKILSLLQMFSFLTTAQSVAVVLFRHRNHLFEMLIIRHSSLFSFS